MSETTIASFVLRFIQEYDDETGAPSNTWRGAIKHVQSNEEIRFTHIQDALNFLATYINLTTGEDT